MSQKMGGIRKIKTAQKAKLRSKPRLEGQEYLELYLMTKEKERMLRYHEVISETIENTEEDIKDLDNEFGKLRRKAGIAEPDSHPGIEAAGTDSPKHKKRKPVKPMKTMVMDY